MVGILCRQKLNAELGRQFIENGTVNDLNDVAVGGLGASWAVEGCRNPQKTFQTLFYDSFNQKLKDFIAHDIRWTASSTSPGARLIQRYVIHVWRHQLFSECIESVHLVAGTINRRHVKKFQETDTIYESYRELSRIVVVTILFVSTLLSVIEVDDFFAFQNRRDCKELTKAPVCKCILLNGNHSSLVFVQMVGPISPADAMLPHHFPGVLHYYMAMWSQCQAIRLQKS